MKRRLILFVLGLALLTVVACAQEVGVPLGATKVPVAATTCAGADKVSAIGAAGAVTCSPDQGGGAAAWGSINGTLSSQTDLQTALNAKEATVNKDQASGYAGLSGSSKLSLAQGQEVWSLADLADVTARTGTGTEVPGMTTTSLAAGDVLSYNGTKWVNAVLGMLVNSQSGVNYTVLTGDKGKLITRTAVSAMSDTLPQAGASFPDGWCTDYLNLGTASVTITPTTSTINGGSTLAIAAKQSAHICSDGTNYEAMFAESPANRNAASGYAGLDGSSKLAASQLPSPDASTLGGVKSIDCTGTGHVLAIGTDGTPTCSADAGGSSGVPLLNTAIARWVISYGSDVSALGDFPAGSQGSAAAVNPTATTPMGTSYTSTATTGSNAGFQGALVYPAGAGITLQFQFQAGHHLLDPHLGRPLRLHRGHDGGVH